MRVWQERQVMRRKCKAFLSGGQAQLRYLGEVPCPGQSQLVRRGVVVSLPLW